ncbi:roadblock/LC7 domain-containing protein [Streptomyces sp. NBC_01243]|uniref:roadblock/LC7 domain-containing protein n=1 Tax=Streptomyces sp. NBC_01243 TaxID=2903796 RepID=UPI003DA2BCC6|nr:roadblock/LC7 domain-containing protein [Streptomyces sp. NBC_01243]
MAPEAEAEDVLAELRRLRAGVPLLSGALVAGIDGLVLAHDTADVALERVAALTAAALGVATRMTEATGRGGFGELLVRGESGCIASYAAGPSAVLTLLAEDGADAAALHLEGRRAGDRIGELIDAARRRAARPVPPALTPGQEPRSQPPQPPQQQPRSQPPQPPQQQPRSQPPQPSQQQRGSQPPQPDPLSPRP